MPGSIATADKLDAIVDRYTQDPYTQLPRAVLLVADRNGIIYEKASGSEQIPKDPNTGRKKNDVTVDSIFELWSCTKLVTTLACLILIERGDMKPEDDVAKWMPEINELKVFKGYKDDKPVLEDLNTHVTVKMLMTHTLGSMLDFGEPTPEYHRYMAEELGFGELISVYATASAEQLKKIPLLQQPGAAFTYGYAQDWAAMLCEKVSGKPWATFLEDNIFKPLGITDMSFKPNPKKVNWAAEQPDGTYTYMDALTLSQTATFGGAGLVGSAKSYMRIVQAVLGNGAVGDVRILKKETVDLMFEPQVTEPQLEGLHLLNSFITAHYFAALGIPLEKRWQHGYGGAWPSETLPCGRGPKDLGWTGAASTYWVCSREKGLAYVLFVNLMPVYSRVGAKLLVELETEIFKGSKSS